MNKEEKIIMEIYRAIYTELGINLDELIENGTTKKRGWFMDYYMPNERQEEIINDILKTKKLSKLRKEVIKRSLWLGATPKG